VPSRVTDPALRERLTEVQRRLAENLGRIDPHHRLSGRPVSYQVIAGQTFEITFRDVPRVDEAELMGVKKLLGEQCVCSISPQTAETITVSFVIPLKT